MRSRCAGWIASRRSSGLRDVATTPRVRLLATATSLWSGLRRFAAFNRIIEGRESPPRPTGPLRPSVVDRLLQDNS